MNVWLEKDVWHLDVGTFPLTHALLTRYILGRRERLKSGSVDKSTLDVCLILLPSPTISFHNKGLTLIYSWIAIHCTCEFFQLTEYPLVKIPRNSKPFHIAFSI